MKLNTIIDNTKNKIVRLPDIMKSFLRNSLAGYLFSASNPRDALVYIKYWILTWVAILKFLGQALFKLGPVGLSPRADQ